MYARYFLQTMKAFAVLPVVSDWQPWDAETHTLKKKKKKKKKKKQYYNRLDFCNILLRLLQLGK